MGWKLPQGVEVLIRKAAVDDDFARLLLADRAAAADEIGLELQPAELAMLAAVPAQQLKAVIRQADVPQEHRRVFLGKAAAAMLAAVAALIPGCNNPQPTPVGGIRPRKDIDRFREVEPSQGDRPDSSHHEEPPTADEHEHP